MGGWMSGQDCRGAVVTAHHFRADGNGVARTVKTLRSKHLSERRALGNFIFLVIDVNFHIALQIKSERCNATTNKSLRRY